MKIDIEITGTRPLLMHSLALLDKFSALYKRRKAITNVRKKTDEDEAELQRLDWLGSIYHDAKLGPYISDGMIEACICEGAKLSKGGRDVKRAIEVDTEKNPLIYDGPRDIDGLWDGGGGDFVDVRGVRNQAARVMRCRPIFRNWSVKFTLNVIPGIIKDADTVQSYLKDAGLFCGIGDYRPKFGRFEVTGFKVARS